MKNNFFPFILLIVFVVPAYPQRNDSIRGVYVERFPDYFFVWPVLKQRSTSFEVGQNKDRSRQLSYKPNNSYGLGFGVYLFEIGAEITFSIPVEEQRNELFGKTKAIDIQANLLGKNWGADVFYQRYTGFYVSDANKTIASNLPYPQRPDMSTDNFGVNGIYIFNKNKFSLRSAYNFAERQRKSAGSFLMTGTVNSFQMKADSAIYGKSYEPVYGSSTAVSEFDNFTIGISPGYTYTLVMKNLFMNGSFSAGPAFRNTDYVVRDVRYSSTGVDAFVDFRGSIGYNSERFFTGVTFVSQSRTVKIDETRFASTSSTFRFLIGYRFSEFGILKKRAVDLIPFGWKK